MERVYCAVRAEYTTVWISFSRGLWNKI